MFAERATENKIVFCKQAEITNRQSNCQFELQKKKISTVALFMNPR